MKLIYDLDGLAEKEVAVFQTAVIATLDQLDIAVDYDEISPDLKEYVVMLSKEKEHDL